MGSITEQATTDEITTARKAWENRSLAFLDVLEDIAQTQVTLDLPDPNISLFLGGFFEELQTKIESEPVKPAGLPYVAPPVPGNAPDVTTPEIETVTIPELTATAPEVVIPPAPELDTLTAPVSPIIRSISPPTAPTVVLPNAPVLTEVQFPDEVTVELPTFTQAFPVEPDLLITKTTFDYSEELIATPTLDLVQAKVESDLVNGGYGIEPDDEQALYDRVRDRETQAAISEEENELRASASRGFTLPAGAAQARMDVARQAARERISEANREISTNRAALFRTTREFAQTTGIAVEAERLRYHGFRLERALNAQRFAAEFSINVFDAQVRKYNAQLAAYQGFVSGYAAKIQAEVTKVEIFRIEVQAAVEQQRAKQIEVDLYNAIVNAETVKMQLFESQVRAAGLELDIERTKMELFRSEVEAFTGLIRAQQLELDKFTSQIRAEDSKVAIFATQVSAFNSQVQAAQVENAVRNRDFELSIEKSKIELDGYLGEVRKYVALVAGEGSRVRGLINEYAADTAVYSTAIGGWGTLTDAAVAEGRTLTAHLAANLRREQNNAMIELRGQAEELTNRLNATKAGVELSGDFATALQGSVQVVSGQVLS